MVDLVTSAQMRAIEAAAIESGAVSGLALMERAGAGVVEALLAQWPELGSGAPRAFVLCGPGNNGGDGYVVARLLAARGWGVEVFLLGDPARLPADARINFERWMALGLVRPLDDLGDGFGPDAPDLVVDALFGTGLVRDLPEAVAALLHGLRAAPRVVAVDVPSGLCADSGRARGAVLRAGLTVTFHAAKPGQYLAEGPGLCGELVVVGIGLAGHSPGRVAQLVTGAVGPSLLKTGGHKYDHGHALVLGGGVGRGGAARLAARAAARVGAGLVTLAVPPAALQENASRLDAVMLRAVKDAEGLAGLLADARINALCLGPGLGVERAAALLPWVLAAGRQTVLDADALTALGEAPGLHAGCVLTPHGGEFRRLFPDLAGRLAAVPGPGVAFSRLDAVRAAAVRAGCVVLLKGPDTVIAAPDGRAAIHAAAYGRAAPWLATAGAGDVLAGLIAGLMARGMPGFEAACAAAWLHVEAALEFGPGLIAEDLPEALPRVFRRIAAG